MMLPEMKKMKIVFQVVLACKRLALGHFFAADTSRAHFHGDILVSADNRMHPLDIWSPDPACFVVRVAHVVSRLGRFSANIAFP